MAKKKDLVSKVAKEQNIEESKIQRLSIPTLEKMDAAIPDEDDLLGSTVVITEDVVAQIKPMERKKTFVGYHPISGEEIYL